MDQFEKWLGGDGDQYTVSEIEMNAARAAWNAALEAAKAGMPDEDDEPPRRPFNPQAIGAVRGWNDYRTAMAERLESLISQEPEHDPR